MRLLTRVLSLALLLAHAVPALAQSCSGSCPPVVTPTDVSNGPIATVGDAFKPATIDANTLSILLSGIQTPQTTDDAVNMALATMLEENARQKKKLLDALKATSAPAVPKTVATDPRDFIRQIIFQRYAAFGAQRPAVQGVIGGLIARLQAEQARRAQLQAQMFAVLRGYPAPDAVRGGRIVADFLAIQQKLMAQQVMAKAIFDARLQANVTQFVTAITAATNQMAAVAAAAQQTPQPGVPVIVQQQLAALGITPAGTVPADPQTLIALATANAFEANEKRRLAYEQAIKQLVAAGAPVPASVFTDPIGTVQAQIVQQFAKYGAKDPDVQLVIGSILRTASSNPNASSSAMVGLISGSLGTSLAADAFTGANITAHYLDAQQKQLEAQAEQAAAGAERTLEDTSAQLAAIQAALIKVMEQMQQTQIQSVTIR